MIDLLKLIKLIDDEDLHFARLLILLRVFSTKSGKKEINSLTKLAKLDFLLRYPLLLVKALKIMKKDPSKVKLENYERHSIESKMVRFKYGPWDFKYKRFLTFMFAKDLISIRTAKNSNFIGLTNKGLEISDKLCNLEQYKNVVNRARILKRYFDKSGNSLKNFIYNTFPEILELKYGEEISYERL